MRDTSLNGTGTDPVWTTGEPRRAGAPVAPLLASRPPSRTALLNAAHGLRLRWWIPAFPSGVRQESFRSAPASHMEMSHPIAPSILLMPTPRIPDLAQLSRGLRRLDALNSTRKPCLDAVAPETEGNRRTSCGRAIPTQTDRTRVAAGQLHRTRVENPAGPRR